MSLQRQINNLRYSWSKFRELAKDDRLQLRDIINDAKNALDSIKHIQDLIIDKVLELEVRVVGLESGTIIRLGSVLAQGKGRASGKGTVV